MYQTFAAATSPTTGGPPLARLRRLMSDRGVQGFLVPRADAHQGEYVAPRDERLAWLTGFTGSAGYAAILPDAAGVFIDGRYTIQVKDQIDLDHFTPVPFPSTDLAKWVIQHLGEGPATIAYDPWLHTKGEIEKLELGLVGSKIILAPSDNLVDAIWDDQPDGPMALMESYPIEFAGVTSSEKRANICSKIDQSAVVLTQPDAIAWLLNTRGADLERTPVTLCFAILHKDTCVDLFMASDKTDAALRDHLGSDVFILAPDTFASELAKLNGPVRVDKNTAPIWVSQQLQKAGVEIAYACDPISLPKACKNQTELAGIEEAHLRDGAAVCEFLCWLDGLGGAPDLTEIDVVKKLEGFRRDTNLLRNISFETISGTGPNGAICHYRVDEDSNRKVQSGDLLLVDSGGQYLDGTTDITRTIPIGPIGTDEIRTFTLVLKGMIAISQLRWPVGLTGRDIDAFARSALWQHGLDYAHGTGHGVGSYLGVHEGPQRISCTTDQALLTGMILSNEPGYYKEGAFGIRIENLIVVERPAPLPNGEHPMHWFRTVTFAPIDQRLIDARLLDDKERDWLNAYHKDVLDKIGPRCSAQTQVWLQHKCAAI